MVDAHSLFRRCLCALLSKEPRFNLVGKCADVQGERDFLAAQLPDFILLDKHMPGVNRAQAAVRILLLTVSENEENLALTVQAGADGYLLKTVVSHKLCDAIVRVMQGRSVVRPQMMNKLFTAFRSSLCRLSR